MYKTICLDKKMNTLSNGMSIKARQPPKSRKGNHEKLHINFIGKFMYL